MRLPETMRPVHVGKAAVRNILEAPGDSGGAVVLHVGYVDDLRELRDHCNHFGSRIIFTEEVHFHIGSWIVIADATPGEFSAVDLNSLRQVLAIVHLVQPLSEAVIDTDLA